MATSTHRRYHHGNLRTALLAAAAEEVQSVGAAQLSLRELARRAGVSHAAPAHHFGDKRGLFTALAAEGFQLLRERTSRELEHQSAALSRAGQRYVEFALDRPGHFNVMFQTSLLDNDDGELVAQRETAFEVLHQAVRLATGVTDDAELAAQTLAAWAVVHGVATLWLTGNLSYPADSGLVTDVFQVLGPAVLPVVTGGVAQLR